jgi:catechol 2,3-dioxygenase-like lactoylglutathione lyase family enzyme
LIDHVHINVADLGRSATFYSAVLEALGQPAGHLTPYFFQVDDLFISQPGPGQALSHVHLAFQAEDRAMVARFYTAAIVAGGTDNGGPGERPYRPGHYSAFVLDPAGNNIEAVFHGPTKRPVPSIVVEPA